MVDNAGKFPVDYTTDVGLFRVRFGDTVPDTEPTVEEPCAGFVYWSDTEIEGFLAAGKTLTRAIAISYDSLAVKLILNSEVIKDFDLTVDPTRSATQMRELAKEWNVRADAEEQGGLEDFMYVVPDWSERGWHRPEGAPYRWS